MFSSDVYMAVCEWVRDRLWLEDKIHISEITISDPDILVPKEPWHTAMLNMKGQTNIIHRVLKESQIYVICFTVSLNHLCLHLYFWWFSKNWPSGPTLFINQNGGPYRMSVCSLLRYYPYQSRQSLSSVCGIVFLKSPMF